MRTLGCGTLASEVFLWEGEGRGVKTVFAPGARKRQEHIEGEFTRKLGVRGYYASISPIAGYFATLSSYFAAYFTTILDYFAIISLVV